MACGDKCALIFTKTTRLADSGTQIELPTKKNGFSDAWVNLPLMLVGNFASGSRYLINQRLTQLEKYTALVNFS